MQTISHRLWFEACRSMGWKEAKAEQLWRALGAGKSITVDRDRLGVALVACGLHLDDASELWLILQRMTPRAASGAEAVSSQQLTRLAVGTVVTVAVLCVLHLLTH